MHSRKRLSLVAITCLFAVGAQAGSRLEFERRERVDVFSVNQPNKAVFSLVDRPYKDWLQSGAGKAFPVDVAPVFSGMMKGNVQTPSVHGIDLKTYNKQAREFAEVVNLRNKGSRPELSLEKLSPAQQIQKSAAQTYIVESVFAAVIDKPFHELKINAESVAKMASEVDVDHMHYQIPGTFVQDVLEKDHIAFESLDLNRNYLLSVFDLRNYQCSVIKDGISHYYSQSPEKDRLHNESIYVVSQVDLNSPTYLAKVEKYFGRRPDAVISQEIIYVDHLLRGGNTIFAFFSEGARTRVVLLSNMGIGKKFLAEGATSKITRPILMEGVQSDSLAGKALRASAAVQNAADTASQTINDFIFGATEDSKSKNLCDRGIALGLIRYSQNLFNEFVKFTGK